MKGRTGSADKTNVMRELDSKNIPYISRYYAADPSLTGVQIAGLLGEPADHVFKTLITQGRSNRNYVFVIPVEAELDLKKAAKAVGEKSVEMIRQKDLLPLTGYVHGGCSPIGMKKAFPTFVHRSAAELDRIYVSAGKVGAQIEIDAQTLISVISGVFADLVV